MDTTAVLEAFNAQVRRNTQPDGTGALFGADGPVVRRIAAAGQDGSAILWSDLTDSSADPVIAAQVDFYSRRGQPFEWKLYSYDQPPDLAARLVAAGFAQEEEEALMVAEAAAVAQDVDAPDGIRLEPVTDAAGVDRFIAVSGQVFGRDEWRRRASLLARLAAGPEIAVLVLAVAGDQAVSSARIEFVPGTEFAGLWGGGTLPQYRKRGIYRALVAYRARLAVSRGYKYLQVDASGESRPILERVGFAELARTTPFIWSPGSISAGCAEMLVGSGREMTVRPAGGVRQHEA
jgi:ribosomal protein S18 acetylase RimI-like enzyme